MKNEYLPNPATRPLLNSLEKSNLKRESLSW